MKYGFRKELVTAAVAIPLALVASGCSSPEEQEPSVSTPSTTASVPATPAPAPTADTVVAAADSASSKPSTAAAAAGSTPAAAPAAGSGRTTADGVYTRAQAARGESTFQNICTACHNAQEFRGSHFAQSWGSRTVGDIHQFISEMMPMDAPGSLTAQEYADVVAFFISQNGYPAGQTELPTSNAALKQIKFAPSSASDD
jgi:hypothetical protein